MSYAGRQARMGRWLIAIGAICLAAAAGLALLAERAHRVAQRQVRETATALERFEAQRVADSAVRAPDTLGATIDRYRSILASAQYHAGHRARSRVGLWRWNGAAAVLTLAGVVLIAGALVGVRRIKNDAPAP